ncbi:general transcription factor IIE subunit 1 [Lingula anatina]|uniref:General transcription factor IIE subunit 1 n=1 Tax=Lingula anatina TaxID=7574 RepID=A0A1S3JWK5_LINAN|nr:general transcription factor IIE subunit 1 [Lingula anatina]XP_013414754.1 general transcription factor IIE subunit 1 [Lingula anatina]XP_013414755.1 general transcription factor IIE subunit 1 [Lingula anatina]|eukprot:XP_013414753.1 general transcription factor IIE subunit 1 [Lingula anatina]
MSTAVAASEPDVLTEVPEALKTLARYVARGFYGIEYALVIDMLVRNPCMKEEDMAELLKYDRKQLRTIMNTLKSDRFIKVRMRVETDSEGKTTRHNYYFINYQVFVNVVKYKLDHMRRKIETQERDSTSRSSFICPECHKSYTDLEAKELLDMATFTFRCTYCRTEVVEDESAVPVQDARAVLARFNEQMERLYKLLREVEDVKLSQDILEPEPTDIRTITGRAHGSSHPKNPAAGDKTVWSGELTKNRAYGFAENTVTISMGEEDHQTGSETKPVKERPIWMVESTVDGAVAETTPQEIKPGLSTQEPSTVRAQDSEDIMRTLLVHEKKTAAVGLPGLPGGSDDESSSSDSGDEASKPAAAILGGSAEAVDEMESDEDDEAEPMVTIGDKKIPFHEVTDDMVHQMTPSEKETFIKMGQDMYADMYE